MNLHVPASLDHEDWVGAKCVAGVVTAVSISATHTFTKPNMGAIRLIAGLGVDGDAHLGVTVKHRTLVRSDPTRPNNRQVHLMHAELHEELRDAGFNVEAGTIGENITTRGIYLLGLPTGTRLHLGREAVVEVTGLRNPCRQLDAYAAGLTAALIGKDEAGNLIRKAGIMSIVLASGEVRTGDAIAVELPALPHQPLPRV
jgi:MOSC domain-containing protein YiiM